LIGAGVIAEVCLDGKGIEWILSLGLLDKGEKVRVIELRPEALDKIDRIF